MRTARETIFANVDVDVRSGSPLEPLAAALGKRVLVQFVGREGRAHACHFSLYAPGNADRAIRTLARLISNLPLPARRVWKTSRDRVFNIGIVAGFAPFSREFDISKAALEAVCRVGAGLTVTVYAPEPRRRRPGALSSR
jgi:hypothetical protein